MISPKAVVHHLVVLQPDLSRVAGQVARCHFAVHFLGADPIGPYRLVVLVYPLVVPVDRLVAKNPSLGCPPVSVFVRSVVDLTDCRRDWILLGFAIRYSAVKIVN